MGLRRDIRRSSAGWGITWSRVGPLAALPTLAGFAALFVAACIFGECLVPAEAGQTVEIPFELDPDRPVATSWIEVSLSAEALPADFEDRGVRLVLTLAEASDVTLTIVPDGTTQPMALIASHGVVSLPLDRCRPEEPCTVRALAVVEWSRPEQGLTRAPRLTVAALARVPQTSDLCGLPGDAIALSVTPPVQRQATARDAVGEERHGGTELVRHVTVRFGADVPDPAGNGSSKDTEPVVVRGHIGITPDADPTDPGARATAVAGLWLRVTPDDGGPPVLDGPIPTAYPPLPADATFPIDPSCARPCEQGYWLQAAVYDPAGRSSVDPKAGVFGWTFDASASAGEPVGAADGSISVTLARAGGGAAPPSLIVRGTGDPFRVDPAHEATTLVIDATVPERPASPFGDVIADASIVFELTTVGVDRSMEGDLWLSNGHYLGDGSTADDEADTGAWGGPGTVSSPAGRPFAPCAGVTDRCIARTGLVLGYYDGVFDAGAPTPPFDVRWDWSVIGAPPDAAITVRTVEGETLDGGIDVGGVGVPTAMIALVVLLAGVGFAALAMRSRKRARHRTRQSPPGEARDEPSGS